MSNLRYISLFSGIEAASCAWRDLPLTPVAFSEIEKFPCNVLAKHYPDVPNLGDITQIKLSQLEALGHVDMIVGGSPCQGFSVAGYQKGLADVRSKLAINYISIIRTVLPKWLLWENVPGVLSSGRGLDFKFFITKLANIGYCLAWRVLDAKYFGVPQRRRRIFLVGYLGEQQSPPPVKILFECESMSGNTSQSGYKKQTTTTDPESAITETSSDVCLDICQRRDVVRYYQKTTPCLTSMMGMGGNNVPLVFAKKRYSEFEESKVAATLAASCGEFGGGSENLLSWGSQSSREYAEQNISMCLCASDAKRSKNLIAREDMRVRKLTPVECLRLQGFPDDWFKDVKGYSDSAAYKAIGNSMAVPCMRWIGERICKYEDNLL